ncbi:MAG: hypothetical protein QXN59_01125 [Candidatus Micrarchaeaceae archaeon]
MAGKKEEKYKKEIEELKRMSAINNILNKGIAESTILNSTTRDDEPSISSISDRLLDTYEELSKGSAKDLEMIERITTSVKGSDVTKEKSLKVSKGKATRNIHIVKMSKPKAQSAKRKKDMKQSKKVGKQPSGKAAKKRHK